MYRFLITFSICLSILLISICKAELEITYQDVEITYADPKFFADPDLYLNDHTSVFINITLVDYLPDTTEITFELIMATMGDYKVPTGIDFKAPLCEILNEPVMVAAVLESMGFRESQCPPEPGVYGDSAFHPSFELYPESYRANNYLSIFELRDEGEQILEVRIYSRVA